MCKLTGWMVYCPDVLSDAEILQGAASEAGGLGLVFISLLLCGINIFVFKTDCKNKIAAFSLKSEP